MTARARATWASSRAGSPGPGERITPSMSDESTSDGRPCAGRPARARRGTASRGRCSILSPRSTIPIRGPVSPGDSELGHGRRRHLADEVLVLPARRRPAAAARAAPTSTSPGAVTIPRRQPFARRCRARARVSTPAMAGIAASRRSAASWRASVEHGGRGVGHDECPQPRADRLVVVGQAAVVADERVGHDHDLAGVRGVGADLLVAGLARVDDEVAAGRDRGAEGDAREDRAVLEGQQGRARGRRSVDRRSRSRAAAVGRSPSLPDTTNPPAPRARWARACEDI